MTRLKSGAGRRRDYAAMVKPARTRRPRRVVATKALTAVVKSIVAKSAEVKNVAQVMENYVLHNSAITAADWRYPLPSITLGAAENQRIGDRVKPKALIIKGTVAFNSEIGGFKTIRVRIHVVKHKKFTSQALLAANISTDSPLLLDDGNGGNTPYAGTILSAQYSLNTDLWTNVKTMDFALSKDNTSPGQVAPPYKEFVIRIPCPQNLVYTTGSVLPENFCPAMAVGYHYVDGSGADVVVTPIVVATQSFFTYTDE